MCLFSGFTYGKQTSEDSVQKLMQFIKRTLLKIKMLAIIIQLITQKDFLPTFGIKIFFIVTFRN